MSEPTVDPRIADIVEAGVIRLVLFLPQFVETSTGEIDPIDTGLVGQRLLGPLAERLNVTLELFGRPSPPKAIETLIAGEADAIFIGIQGSRQSLVAFTAPVIRFDYGYMVPDGSPIEEASEVDRPGRRISAVRGHASTMALEGSIEHAEILLSDVPQQAFALFRGGGADVFAIPRVELFDYAPTMPGSRILAEGFGFNTVGFAIAKDRSPLLGFIDQYVADTKASGVVQRILDDLGLSARGVGVANAA
jgi:polar amino acid transport system substrate-binding protein